MIELDEESKHLLQEALAPLSAYQGAVNMDCRCILDAYDPEFIHRGSRRIARKLTAKDLELLREGNIDALIEAYSLDPDQVESARLWDITIMPA